MMGRRKRGEVQYLHGSNEAGLPEGSISKPSFAAWGRKAGAKRQAIQKKIGMPGNVCGLRTPTEDLEDLFGESGDALPILRLAVSRSRRAFRTPASAVTALCLPRSGMARQ